MAEGFKIADAYVDIVANLDRQQVRRAVRDTITEVSPQIEKDAEASLGKAFTAGITKAFTSRFSFKGLFSNSVQEDVERESRTTIGRAVVKGISGAFAKSGEIGIGFLDGLSKGFGALATSLGTNPVVLGLGLALAATLGPVVAGALSAAVTAALGLGLGGGLLALGAVLLKDNKKLVAQVTKSWAAIKKTMADAASPLVGPFVQALKDVQKLVKDLAPDFKSLFAGLAPIVPMLTTGLAGFMKPLLAGLKDSMPGINAAFAGLTKNMPVLGASIGNFFRVILRDAPLVEKVTGSLIRFFAWLFDVAGPSIERFTVLFAGALNIMRLFQLGVGDIWDALVTKFDMGSGAIARLTAAWAPLKAQLQAVWDKFREFARADDDVTIANKFFELVVEIKKLWGPLKDFLGVVWDEAWAFVKRVWEQKVKPWWENTAEPWLMEKIKAGVKAAFNAAVEAGANEMAKLPGRIMNTLGTLPGLVTGAVVQGFAAFPHLLYNAGTQLIQGLINGINAKIGSLKSLLNGITNMIPQIKGPPAKDKKLLEPAGKLIMQGLQTGMESQMAGLKSMLGAFTASLPAATSGQGQPAGRAITVHVDGAVFADEESLKRLVDLLYRLLDDHEKAYA